MNRLGIDVSGYDKIMNWDKAKAAGVTVATIRASVANGTPPHLVKDSFVDRNRAEARRVGIDFMLYHVYEPALDPTSQALFFLDICALDGGTLPKMVDLEVKDGIPVGYAYKVQTCLQQIEAVDKAVPYIYTGPYYWLDYLGAPAWGDHYPLIIAHYGVNPKLPPVAPLVPSPWSPTRWTGWQYTGKENGAKYGSPCAEVALYVFQELG